MAVPIHWLKQLKNCRLTSRISIQGGKDWFGSI